MCAIVALFHVAQTPISDFFSHVSDAIAIENSGSSRVQTSSRKLLMQEQKYSTCDRIKYFVLKLHI